jgi:pimeloyl-ACP methyl ester carboxylesterase
MPTVKTKDGVEIFYKDWGSGQPIVFSHGWPLSGDDWDIGEGAQSLRGRFAEHGELFPFSFFTTAAVANECRGRATNQDWMIRC